MPNIRKQSKQKPAAASGKKIELAAPTAVVQTHSKHGRADSRLWVVLLLNALLIAPLLWSGYLMDDFINAQIRGALIQAKMGIWAYTGSQILAWIRNIGRLFPLAFLCFPLFYYCQSLIAYKFLVFVVVLADVSVFYLLVRRLSYSADLALFSGLLLPLFIQFRATADPILSFSCLYPLLALFLFSSLLFFLRYLEVPAPGLLGLSLLCFILSALMFELPLLLSTLYVVIPWRKRKSVAHGLRIAAPFLALDLFWASVMLYCRSQAANLAQSPYALHLAPVAVFKAAIAQFAGLIPFLYASMDPSHVIQAAAEGSFWIGFAAAAVFVAALSLLWRLHQSVETRPFGPVKASVLPTAFLLLLLPPLLITLSPKYQRLAIADSYLPVYLSCFGISILAAAAILRFLPKLMMQRTSGRILLVLTFAAGGYAWNFRNNALVVSFLNRQNMGRAVARDAARAGFFQALREDGVILNIPARPWELDTFFAEASGHREMLLGLDAPRDYRPILLSAGASCAHSSPYDVCTMPPNGKVFFFRLEFPDAQSTALILSRLSTIVLEHGTARALSATDTDLFFSSPRGAFPPVDPVVRGQYTHWSEADNPDDSFWAGSQNLRLKWKGPRGQWFQLRTGPLEATSLKVYAETPEAPGLPPIVKPRNSAEFHLKSARPPLIHTGYTLTKWGDGVILDRIPAIPPLSIELVVVPEPVQTPYATILSNHGSRFGGLSIEQEGGASNHYAVMLGTGSSYQIGAEFTLAPLRRHYLAVEIQRGVPAVYVDGVVQTPASHSTTVVDSGLPLRLGNWFAGGRTFSGQIEELLIAPEVRSPAEIRTRATVLGVLH